MKEGLNPIHNPTEKKESKVGALIFMQTMGEPAWTPRDYASFAKEGYIQNAIVYRCIRLISDACMSVPLEVYDDKGKPIEEHEFYDLMAHPNPFEGMTDILDALYSFLFIAGNTYLEFASSGAMRELYVLRPDRVKVALDPKGRPAKYTYSVSGGNDVDFPVRRTGQREILHIKNFHPLHDIYGLSAIEPAAFSIGCAFHVFKPDQIQAYQHKNGKIRYQKVAISAVLGIIPPRHGSDAFKEMGAESKTYTKSA